MLECFLRGVQASRGLEQEMNNWEYYGINDARE